MQIKQIETLLDDINKVLQGSGGWDSTVSQFFSEGLVELVDDRFTKKQEVRNYLSLSQVGDPCRRKLWYRVNQSNLASELSPESIGNFFYGDLLELVVISLAMAAGHRVDGLQQELDVFGVKGHGDVLIDGMVVDVKSASRFGFEKFKNHKLKEDDPFGYISQLSSYLYAYKDDSRVVHKDKAAFLVVNKDRFKLALDVYDLRSELAAKEKEIKEVVAAVESPVPPPKLPDEPEGKSGNRKLSTICGYCDFKHNCWPNLRAFSYSNGLTYLTHVAKLPKVYEVTKREALVSEE
jgi:CRISPR/Cas system-associated exonuclease Cas4 (RecB family)